MENTLNCVPDFARVMQSVTSARRPERSMEGVAVRALDFDE
jgi:hypothetical protein